MNSSSPERAFEDALRNAAAACGLSIDKVPIAYPPTAAQGDLASPVCFDLARAARKAPRILAESLVAAFVPAAGIARVEAAGNGYINAFLARPALLRAWLVSDRQARAVDDGKTIVEHTNINPNKAAHIGHLRNAVLGDTLVRFLGQLGRHVEVQNYIDDTGVQVADLVVGFRVLRGEELDARELLLERALPWTAQDPTKPNYACPSLLDPDSTSRSFDTVGNTAYVYFTRNNRAVGDLDRHMLRVPVEFFRH